MNRIIEVIYEDNVLKPLKPIKGLKKNERTWVIICPHPKKKALRELVGTLSSEEAEEMQKLIDEEFEKIEGEW
ncbi:MAG TPA: antitoxin family protein [Syntrophomonadaceae bacterium]|nr:antitoxin family protein [Syntrophomonadaceae bacterium]